MDIKIDYTKGIGSFELTLHKYHYWNFSVKQIFSSSSSYELTATEEEVSDYTTYSFSGSIEEIHRFAEKMSHSISYHKLNRSFRKLVNIASLEGRELATGDISITMEDQEEFTNYILGLIDEAFCKEVLDKVLEVNQICDDLYFTDPANYQPRASILAFYTDNEALGPFLGYSKVLTPTGGQANIFGLDIQQRVTASSYCCLMNFDEILEEIKKRIFYYLREESKFRTTYQRPKKINLKII